MHMKMNLSESLSDAFEYTKGLFSRFGDLIILTILAIIPIVNFFVLGYYARVLRDGPASRGPPRVERYLDMFVDGLKYFVALIIWSLPIIAVAAVSVGSIIGLLFLTGGMAWYDSVSLLPLSIILLILPALGIIIVVMFLIYIVALMGVVHMFKTGSFTKAFAINEILGVIRKIGWGNYLGWLLIVFIIGLVFSAVGSVPIIGWLLSAFLWVLLLVFSGRSIGLLYDSATGRTEAPPTGSGATPPAIPPPPPIQPPPPSAP